MPPPLITTLAQCTMPRLYRQYKRRIFIITPKLAVASVIQLTLAAEAFKRRHSDVIDVYSPANLFNGREALEVLSASLNLASAIVVGGVSHRPHLETNYTLMYRLEILFALRVALVAFLGISAVLSVATFLYAFITHGRSAHFDSAYDESTFDLETWACESRDFLWYDDELYTLCVVETGARWTTLFLFLLASALLVLVWLDRRGKKQLVTTWKRQRASWHDDYY
ncbi:hypothetical protein GGR58DRAFT_519084 [Xylaria digitata]|nr:hypothetical protein GGR58DRAFT_519084 [Xylaria digitata]